MVYLILGGEKIDAFKQELIENKYGIFQDHHAVWDIIVSQNNEIGLSNEENGCMEIITLTDIYGKKDEKLQRMVEKYEDKPHKPI